MNSPDMSVIGVAFMAGLYSNVWNNKNELKEILVSTKSFSASSSSHYLDKIHSRFKFWKKSCRRFADFDSCKAQESNF